MTLQVCRKGIPFLKTEHRIPKPRCPASGDESELNVVVPTSVGSFANVVVIEAVTEIKTGQFLVKRVVWPKLVCKMSCCQIRGPFPKLPQECLLNKERLVL